MVVVTSPHQAKYMIFSDDPVLDLGVAQLLVDGVDTERHQLKSFPYFARQVSLPHSCMLCVLSSAPPTFILFLFLKIYLFS